MTIEIYYVFEKTQVIQIKNYLTLKIAQTGTAPYSEYFKTGKLTPWLCLGQGLNYYSICKGF